MCARICLFVGGDSAEWDEQTLLLDAVAQEPDAYLNFMCQCVRDDVVVFRFTHRIVDMISDVYTSATVSFSSPTQDTSSRSPPKNIIWGGNVEPNVGDSPVTYNMVARPDVVQELPPNEYIMEIW